MRKLGFVGVAVAAMIFAAPVGAASKIFTLGTADVTSGLGAGPFGTVKVTESAGALDFLITLNSGFRFHKTQNAQHNAFTFGLLGDPNVTVSNLSSNKFVGYNLSSGTNVKAPPFANAADVYSALKCTGCGPGWGGGFAGPLSFTVTSSAGSLSLNSLAYRYWNQKQVFFTADLVNGNGRTGNVAAFDPGAPVPEPATWLMLIAGFGAVGGAMRSRQRRAAFA